MATGTALADWGGLLGFLNADLASAVEGIGRRLQPLMERDPHDHDRGAGEPDGFAGIARGGDLSHLLLTEWLLADEEPLEFLRRFVMAELGYLLPERREPRQPGRVVVIADAGPDQVGGPRMVHLAALAVLHRRAAADGGSVSLGMLGMEPGRWIGFEDLPGQLAAWRLARESVRPEPEAVEGWLGALEPLDRCWLFGAEPAFDREPGLEGIRPVRRLGARELTWTAEGARRLDVRVDDRRLTIEMPPPRDAVRLLRGGDTNPRGRRLETTSLPVRFPRFTGTSRRLVCRTDRPDEIMSISLANDTRPGTPGGRRRFRFDGPVLAAGASRRRTIVLVHEAGRIRAVALGRSHREIESILVAPAQLGLDQASMDELVSSDLAPILPAWSGILVRLDGTWRFISAHAGVDRTAFAAATPSANPDVPRLLRLMSSGQAGRPSAQIMPYEPHGEGGERPVGRPPLLGPAATEAWPVDDGYLLAARAGSSSEPIALPAGSDVLGIALEPDRPQDPFLVVRSEGGLLLRCHWPDRVRTLGEASGDVVDATLHPTEPLLVVQRTDGSLEAFSVPRGTSRGVLRPELS